MPAAPPPLPTLGNDLDAMERGLSPLHLAPAASLAAGEMDLPRWVECHLGRGRVVEENDEAAQEMAGRSNAEIECRAREILMEAREIYFHADYVASLLLYARALALFQRSPGDPANMPATLHNIASCLHQLDELNEAQEWYARAIALFRAQEPQGRLKKMFSSDVNRRRIEFSQQRMQMAAAGRLPDAVYLDASGHATKGPTSGQGEDANR
jgi:tetratricopeptide (TPR) repeat protein